MNRFASYEKPKRKKSGWLLALASTFILFICCYLSLSNVSHTTLAEQQASLERAVRKNMVQCYITEGTYPESLTYLIENYPLIYDETTFYIDYQPVGSNLMPDVTVLIRPGK